MRNLSNRPFDMGHIGGEPYIEVANYTVYSETHRELINNSAKQTAERVELIVEIISLGGEIPQPKIRNVERIEKASEFLQRLIEVRNECRTKMAARESNS